jgi:predicted ATP-dependent Lon-type protease
VDKLKMANKMIDIDNKLWNKFRKKCVNEDITMKEKLKELVAKYVEET